ncbi:MAG: glucose-1-phosphate cytidylyltransferase [Cyanobacteria bacterium DS3.002]|nr:glucose-1-phosphate cytidylyltransferase [Cyanobacteria bacterium DS3.002]MBA4049658.1 glucose-1-phosphate cytidylyltransferase [Cyanobacteria bacterium DS2.008]
MKAVILAGGLGTRISEETHRKPKPMIEIGGKPILRHIMKIYSDCGINDFVICCGYKGFVTKEYFANYLLHTSYITFDMRSQSTEVHENTSEPWRVTLVDTGEETMTGGRLKRVAKYLNDEAFCLTYGDGVADVKIDELIRFHKQSKGLITVTAVQPPGRFGSLSIDMAGRVTDFEEKPVGDGKWINGSFFVIKPEFLEYLDSDSTPLEGTSLLRAAEAKSLRIYKHSRFWQAMDTLRDNTQLNKMWHDGSAPWRVWTAGSSSKISTGKSWAEPFEEIPSVRTTTLTFQP